MEQVSFSLSDPDPGSNKKFKKIGNNNKFIKNFEVYLDQLHGYFTFQ